MSLKTDFTKLHYNINAKGLFFNILKMTSLFYGVASNLKNFLYDKKFIQPLKVEAKVISIGNFTTGGVGKTPVVAEIAKYFVQKGEKVAIISRGYGGKLDNKSVHVISDGINLYYKADMAGDEPYWLAVNLNMCAVLTCANRYKAAKYAVEKLGINVIILDDGFQHRKFHRDLNVVLVDSEKLFGNGYLLPAGPLREPLTNFSRVDKLVVVSKNIEHNNAETCVKQFNDEFFKNQFNKVFLCKVEPDYVYNIISGEHLDKHSNIVAMSAIGQPEQFYKFLENDYKIIKKVTFDDHHQYTIEDLADIEENIVTTEKDAVKLAILGKTNIYALKLKTTIDVKGILQE